MCLVAEIWQQNGLKQDTVVTKLFFKFIAITSTRNIISYKPLQTAPSGPRQEA